MKTSESIKEISTALAKAQAVMAGAKKDATNPHYKSKYADLASVWEACRKPLADNGIAVVQMTDVSERDEIIVETRLTHTSGEWIEGRLALPVSKADAQGFGSALTYARRYGLSAAVGIAPEDDDGNLAAAARPIQKAYPNGEAHAARAVAVDAMNAMDEEQQNWIKEQAMEIIAVADKGGDVQAHYIAQHYDNEEKLALWSLLPSKVRTAIKRTPNGSRLAEQA